MSILTVSTEELVFIKKEQLPDLLARFTNHAHLKVDLENKIDLATLEEIGQKLAEQKLSYLLKNHEEIDHLWTEIKDLVSKILAGSLTLREKEEFYKLNLKINISSLLFLPEGIILPR